MRVAGIGFRGAAVLSSLQDALQRAGGEIDLLATAEKKAETPVARALAATLDLNMRGISRDLLAQQDTLTHSAKVAERFGTGSVAEAAALAAAGPGGRLLGPRVISADGLATAAIAVGRDE
jgi:cobalt-precorrin 5A hydrolase